MGHRLSKIYTRTGDKGETGLGDGSRVPKNDTRVEAYGTVDELNCCVGLLLSNPDLPPSVVSLLTDIQHRLFDLGGELCIPAYQILTAKHTEKLECEIDWFNQHLPMLKDFILPGGSLAASHCHLARSVCRRAERCTYTLSTEAEINPHALTYLNRLSDLLFVMARFILKCAGVHEVLWRR